MRNVILVLLIIFLSFAGLGLKSHNHKVIDDMLDDTTKTFVTVSVIKGVVDVIEGTSLAGVEVGDISQPVLDCLNVLWKFLLCALAFWGSMKMLFVGPSVLALLFLLAAGIIFMMHKKVGKYMVFCAFLCASIPFLIAGTGAATHYMEPMKLDAEKNLQELSEIFSLDGMERQEDLKWYNIVGQTKQLQDNSKFFSAKVMEILEKRNLIVSDAVNGMWKYIVVLLMNSIVIPALIFLFMLGLCKVMLVPEASVIKMDVRDPDVPAGIA